MFDFNCAARKTALKSAVVFAAIALITFPTLANANPNLTPGVWTNITPAAAQIGASYGLNYFTQGITIDPNNPNVLYFSMTGYDANFNVRPANIWKTADAGSNWTALTPLDAPIHVRVDPTNSNHLYAVDGVRGSTLGFWVSTNAGATWTQPAGFTTLVNNLSTQGFGGFNDGYAIDVDPSNPNHILYSSHSQWGIVGESFDGGNTWTSHTTPAATGSGGYAVFFLYSPNLAVGNAQTWLFCTQTAGVYRTTNSGATWTLVPTANAMNHGGNQIYYTKSGVLYAGSNSWPTAPQVSSPMKSTDNGVTWQAGAAPSGCMGIIGDGTNLYTGLWWGNSPILTSLETDGQHWTASSGSPTFNNAGPFEMAYDKVNGIVYSSNTSNGVTQTTGSGDGIWAYKVPGGSGPPAAPTGLTATPGNTQVALTWNASSGATAYDVKRSTISGSGYATVSSPTVTNYTNTGLTNGTTYYFVVDAKNASGTSGNSGQASATPSAGSPPGAPTGLTAIASDAQIALTWNASTGATSYSVYRGTAIATGITATNYTNTGLTDGTTYYYTVKAVNSSGTSVASSEAHGVPCEYNFESGIQGWTFLNAPVTGIAQSSTQAFGPTHSLAVTINGAAANSYVRISNPPTPAGKVVTYHVWVPTGSQLSAIQPYVMDHNWAWTGTIVPLASLTQGAWNTITVTVPTGAAMPLNELGVEFRVSAIWNSTCYIDSISW